jgi:hypothetical protein
MHTSFALFALAGFLGFEEPVTPTWLTNYSQAQQVGKKEAKPLAVFVGAGPNGYQQVSREGALSPRVQELLAQSYVCVYLDLESSAARKLAAACEITRDRGLVLSDRSGQHQAFHHDGDLSEADLVRNLERFASRDFALRTTETNNTSRISYYPPSGNGGAPRIQVPAYSGRSC